MLREQSARARAPWLPPSRASDGRVPLTTWVTITTPRFSQQNATRRKLLKFLPPVRRGPQSAPTVAMRELGSGAKQGREEQRRRWPPCHASNGCRCVTVDGPLLVGESGSEGPRGRAGHQVLSSIRHLSPGQSQPTKPEHRRDKVRRVNTIVAGADGWHGIPSGVSSGLM